MKLYGKVFTSEIDMQHVKKRFLQSLLFLESLRKRPVRIKLSKVSVYI